MNNRVVITGLGVVAPNGTGIAAFSEAIKKGISGIRYDEQLAALKFSCQIAGMPEVPVTLQQQYFEELELKQLSSSGIIYGVIAGMQAWADAGLPLTRRYARLGQRYHFRRRFLRRG
ncbi:beta-ketoacyl synthase N-terminal-like domain-containing protein [Chitinophaga sp. OAE865]|uniref:beta-ketoacyl synthase N-terminal-like domain-containing protein n=1 Tax=Chitinophaga sp. OAE865 TaxID=2817898 RepID=UPI0033934B7C